MRELAFRHVLALIACVIIICLLQAFTGADGALSALVGLLTGIIAGALGAKYYGEKQDEQGEQEVPLGNRWRR